MSSLSAPRIASVTRKTGETDISLTLNVDGTGICSVDCPIGFFKHILSAFCKHGLFDLSGTLKGDLDVDQHHLIEDTGIVIGALFDKALGNRKGIMRAGFFLYPMDETLSRAAVDFGGRSYLVCNAQLSDIPLSGGTADNSQSVCTMFQTDTFEDFGRDLQAVQNATCTSRLFTAGATTTRWKVFLRRPPVLFVRLLQSMIAFRMLFLLQRVQSAEKHLEKGKTQVP